jgi:hypothetical protein
LQCLDVDVKEAIEWFKHTYTVHPAAAFPLIMSGDGRDANAEGWVDFVKSIRPFGLNNPRAIRTA